jgi:predicted nucleotidyltransferase
MSNAVINPIAGVDNGRLAHLCRQYHVSSLKVFGSVLRGDDRADSDIDVLVKFTRPLSLLHLIRFERELSDVFGRKVDLVTEQSLSDYLRPSIVADSQVIYDVSR